MFVWVYRTKRNIVFGKYFKPQEACVSDCQNRRNVCVTNRAICTIAQAIA